MCRMPYTSHNQRKNRHTDLSAVSLSASLLHIIYVKKPSSDCKTDGSTYYRVLNRRAFATNECGKCHAVINGVPA